MHVGHEFLTSLAVVLCVAAVTTVVFQRLHQPVVLGYLLAGLVVGPHVPIPLVADADVVQTLAEVGVILLMFSLGLEFSLKKLFKLAPTAGITAVIQCSLMIWLGFAVASAFGWGRLEGLFTGALIAISSTTIIVKAFDEQKVTGSLRDLVIGILIVEDLIAIVLMAVLTAVAKGAGVSGGELFQMLLKLGGFLVTVVGIGLLVVPRTIRAITKLGRPETTVVASVGLSFAIALLAQKLGYSVALGAFLAGMLVAESGESKRIEHLVEPVRDVFASVFFVSVGMLIDPRLVAEHWGAIAVLTAVVIVGKLVGVSLGAFLTGSPPRTSVQAGMSLAQIGEFSFIIASMGLTLGATRSFLYPIAVAVSAITTLTTPWLIKASGPFANLVDRKLPRRLQTVAALYGSWLEGLRSSPSNKGAWAQVRRGAFWMVADTAILAAIIIGTARAMPWTTARLEHAGVPELLAKSGGILLAFALAAPFAAGIVRLSRRLGRTLAELSLPAVASGKLDLAAAPRKVLLVTLQLGCVLLLGIPLLAVTQPFLPFKGALLLVALAVMLAVGFWRSAANLEGHVRAGAQVILEALRAQTRPPDKDHALEHVNAMLPGLGEPVAIRLSGESNSVGKTLAELNLRGMTGATVLAIQRGSEELLVPSAQEPLRDGDVLAVAGSHEATAAAAALLQRPREA